VICRVVYVLREYDDKSSARVAICHVLQVVLLADGDSQGLWDLRDPWATVPRVGIDLVGREVGPPLTEDAEGRPELALGALLVECVVDVGDVEGLDAGRQLLQVAG
jgi:hypothetical protein